MIYQIRQDKVIYTICTTHTITNNFRFVKYRYSQLKDINSQLQRIELPQFPKRKLFGSTNKSQEAIQQRKLELEEYLMGLMSIPELYNLELLENSFLPDQIQTSLIIPKFIVGDAIKMYIDRYTLAEDVVIYYARMKDLDSQQEWIFKYRYSDFRNLHDALQKARIKYLQLLKLYRPQFPKRKLFGITNDSPQDIQKRRQQLQTYFNQIFSSKELIGNIIVKSFIEQTKRQAQRQIQTQKIRKDKIEFQ